MYLYYFQSLPAVVHYLIDLEQRVGVGPTVYVLDRYSQYMCVLSNALEHIDKFQHGCILAYVTIFVHYIVNYQ